jgi:hypothetical protein
VVDEGVVGRDGLVEVRWAYTPKDRAKQGTTERIAPELAAIKVREGSAAYTGRMDEPALPVAVPAVERPLKQAASRQAPSMD